MTALIFADLLHLCAAFTYGLNARSIGILATAASSISLPIAFLSGYLMDRLGRKKTMIPGFTGVTVVMLALAVPAIPIVFAFLAGKAGYPASFVFVAGAALIVAFLLIRYVPETVREQVRSEPVASVSSPGPATQEAG